MEREPGFEARKEAEQQFREAVEAYHVDSLPVEFESQAAEAFENGLRGQRLAVLGEMHGASENPAGLYALMKRFNIRGLALEWQAQLRPMIDEYFRTGRFDFSQIAKSADGRITAGHFAFLKRLHDEGGLSQLILFDDPEWEDWNTRDRQMAEHVLRDRDPSVPTLIVAGNLHARTEPFEDEGAMHHPMGEHLKTALPSLPAGQFVYQTGRFYNLGSKRFDQQPNRLPVPRWTIQENGRFALTIPEAHEAEVPNREIQEE